MSILFRFISLNFYLFINEVRYFFRHDGFKPINVSNVFRIISNRKNPVTFIQIGCYDGISNDPIYDFVIRNDWHGILVEPMQNAFNKLKQNYHKKDNIVLENVAISNIIGDSDFYHLPAQFNDPEWLQQIGSFDRSALLLNLQDSFSSLVPEIISTRIRSITLASLMEKHSLNSLDVLVIDAEGAEFLILKDLNNLVVKPEIILFEWGCMRELDLNALLHLLKGNKYRIYKSGGDMLCIKIDV